MAKKTGEIYKWRGKMLSLTALSRALNDRGFGRGTTVSNLSKIFSGEYDPRFEMVKALADIIGVSLEEFDELLQTCRRAHSAWERMMDEASEADEHDTGGELPKNEQKVVGETLG
jgi:transcriptional regulator with XRE-family HTH domain